MSANEPIASHRKVTASSDRNFGFVFAALFTLVGVLPWLHGGSIRPWAIEVAAVFLAAGFFVPWLLRPLNRVWFRIGLALHAVVNPIIMAVIFYCAFVPMGLMLRVLGKDLLRLKREPKVNTYWVMREPAGPQPGSMSKQF